MLYRGTTREEEGCAAAKIYDKRNFSAMERVVLSHNLVN